MPPDSFEPRHLPPPRSTAPILPRSAAASTPAGSAMSAVEERVGKHQPRPCHGGSAQATLHYLQPTQWRYPNLRGLQVLCHLGGVP
ncbi:hypothetical protein ACQJBY_005588 [Aegilops geniculata]